MTALLSQTPTPKPVDEVELFIDPPDDKLYDLVEGQLLEKCVSTKSVRVAFNIGVALEVFAKPRGLGWAATELPIMCFPWLTKHGRRPDVVFYRTDRLAAPGDEPLTVAPSIVVEVISPTDRYTDVEQKIAEYAKAGVDLIWIVDYGSRTIRVHRADAGVRIYGEAETLTAEPVLEGFSVAVRDLLPAAPTTEPAAG
jgi:Uma2 family endonuclease